MPDLSHGMDEQVEAGARALYEHEAAGHLDALGWDGRSERLRERYRASVRAVLRSLPGSEAREVAKELRDLADSQFRGLGPMTKDDLRALADRLDRAPTREGPTRDEIADTAQDAAADCGKPLDPDVADVIAARVLALSPTEPCATCGGTRVIAQDSHSPCVECDPPCPDCSHEEREDR
jgi:hypothetical protein